MLQEKGKSRSDFTTEEDWQKYKSNKEAMPKAAFQFGVKMTEGRKVHRDLGKAKDAKLNNQLNKIQGIMEKKVLHLSAPNPRFRFKECLPGLKRDAGRHILIPPDTLLLVSAVAQQHTKMSVLLVRRCMAASGSTHLCSYLASLCVESLDLACC